MIHYPVCIDALNRYAHMTVEIPAQIVNDFDEGGGWLVARIIIGNTLGRIDRDTAGNGGLRRSFGNDGG